MQLCYFCAKKFFCFGDNDFCDAENHFSVAFLSKMMYNTTEINLWGTEL